MTSWGHLARRMWNDYVGKNGRRMRAEKTGVADFTETGVADFTETGVAGSTKLKSVPTLNICKRQKKNLGEAAVQFEEKPVRKERTVSVVNPFTSM